MPGVRNLVAVALLIIFVFRTGVAIGRSTVLSLRKHKILKHQGHIR